MRTVAIAALLLAGPCAWAVERGTIRFQPVDEQSTIPERYRLEEHRFDFELELKHRLRASGLSVYQLRFPSPVESPHPENNTVHGEYYVPEGRGPFPGVVVLDITGGDQSLSRSLATYLAQKGVAALFVQMAYYGPRRPAGSNLRLLSTNIPQTFEAIRQTVLDVRRAGAWLEARPEIDRERLGIMGTSLGSMIGALAAEMEPRFRRVSVLLGGGGLIDGYYDHPKAAPYRKAYEALGGTKERLKPIVAPVDPLTLAGHLKNRRVLIIAGRKDDMVPPRMSEALWEATGKQKIVWYDCDHYGAAAFLVPALTHIVEHFTAP